MTKQTVLEHFEKTVSNAKERLTKLIESAEKYGLDGFMAGLATAVEVLEDEEIEKLETMFQLTVEEYVEMHKKGMGDSEIAKVKGITNQQLYSWKYFRKGHIKRALEQEAQQEIASTLEESETQAMLQESIATEETQSDSIEEDDEGIEWLKREAIHAHKMLTEKEKEVEHWKELFETAMADKERLHKENLFLENHVQRLKESISELTERNERYFASLTRLEQEVKGLRLYALQKLHMDVYGA